jgi:pimeloyl-ACP methyl ester carboxylesterase
MSSSQGSYAHLADGWPIYFFEEGAGPPLLFLHGGACGADDARPLFQVLRDRFRCISLDRLGYRRSAHLDRNTTPEQQASAIEAVHHDVTSEPAWAFGHSSGGNFALAYALFHPDSVKGLILMEPALYAIYPPEQKPPEVERMQNVAMPLFQQGQVEKGWDEFIEAIFGPRQQPPPSRTEADLDRYRSFGYDQPVVITWCPSEAQLLQMTQPVLIIEGDKSPAVLRNICHLLDGQLGNSRLITLKGLDHGALWSAPDVLAQTTTEFIERVVASE